MKLFKSRIETLRESAPAKTSTRFIAGVIDIVLVALLAGLIFSGAFLITSRSERYEEAEAAVRDEIDYYERLTEDTHIVEYVDGSRATLDVVVLKNVYRAICLSYDVFGNVQQKDFVIDPSHPVRVNGVHSAENDNVAYFYTRYLRDNPDMGIGAERDVFEIYRSAFGDDASFMFSFDRERSEIPVLNTQVAYYIFHYLFVDESDSIGQTGATYYRSYYNAYSHMLEEAEQLIIESEPYNSTHYVNYKAALTAQARYTNIALLISIFISCFAVLLASRYIFGDGRTPGYMLLGLGVVGVGGERIEWYNPLIKTAVYAVGAIPITSILYMFPPFNGRYESMFMPVTVDGGISLGLLVLIITLLWGIVNAFGLFTRKRQNLLNLIFNDLVVDPRYPDDDDDGSTNHGRSY